MPLSFLRPTAGLCILLLAVLASAQAPAQQGAPTTTPAKQGTPVLRVTTRLVQVNVIVRDKKGEPVPDLTRDDFVLLDKGQEQPIRVFSVESTRAVPAPAQPVPTNFYSNRYEHRAGVPANVTVILLDALNTRFEDMAYSRMQIIKFLGQLQPQDRVALYALTTRLRVLHDFTTDASRLLRAIERYKDHSSHELAASETEPADTGNADLDAFLNEAAQHAADFYTINRAAGTADAIEWIANHVARLPGRKNLVWVSSSFPFSIGFDEPMTPGSTRERRIFSDDVERAARALNNANLAIYPVDARGLIAPFSAATGFNPARGLGPRGGRFPGMNLSPSRANFDTMNILAERTGGRAFYNTNDIQGSIRRAIEDSRVTYMLGYYPSHGEWDSKFREIKIQVRRPGLRLRYRRGYFALSEAPLNEKQRQALLRETLTSPLDATSLGLGVKADPVDVPGARTLKTALEIDSRDVTLRQESGRWVGAVDVVFMQLGADGKSLGAEIKTVSMQLTRERYDTVMKEGLVLNRNLPVKPGAEQLRIVVRDVASGATGSVRIPIGKLFASASN